MITDEDIRLFDLLTYSYRSYALISDLTDMLISETEQKSKGPATQFYFKWCDKRLEGKYEIPFNKGTVWMITSVIIVTSKERWLKLLPETPISESSHEWGLLEARLSYPTDPNPSIRKIVQKIRNSISHSDFDVKVGREGTSWDVLLKETTFTFRDSREKGGFELEISLSSLSKLCMAIYQTIQVLIERTLVNQDYQNTK